MSINRYKRELQIAQNLIVMRWVSIPVIFGFCSVFIYNFKMSFRLEPIYILCCLIAVFNIFLTIHISMIERQLSVTRGLLTLKKALRGIFSNFFAYYREHKIKGIFTIPKTIVKAAAVIYLMVLEALRDFPMNFLSLHNVIHVQILFDIAVIIGLTRFTGSTESPMFLMAAIPVAVAGSVINGKTGIVYAVLACLGWVLNSMLIKLDVMSHIKFYNPLFGDLHSCDGWIASYAMVSVASFSAFAIISHKLTQIFKKRIRKLDTELSESRSSSIAYKYAALTPNNPWVIIDKSNKILSLKSNQTELLNPTMIEKGILEVLPDLAKTDFEFAAQAAFSSHCQKNIDEIKINFKDGSVHIYDLVISAFKDSEGKECLILCFDEKTLEVNRKELVDSLRAECLHSSNNINKLKRENTDLQQSLSSITKISSDKSIEIETLNSKINAMGKEATEMNREISGLKDQVASCNTNNELLKVELNNRQMILEDVADFMANCSDLEFLVNKVEHRLKDLFGLENSCFHVFCSGDALKQKNEILDMRQVSPRLLDIPRNHPETLDLVLNEGRPVVVNAEFRTENSSTSIAVSDGDLKRMVAFVPVKENDELLGMMMLEKFGVDGNSDNIIDMVSYYLKHIAGIIKSAVENQKAQQRNQELHHDIIKIQNKFNSVKTMILSDYSKELRPFGTMLFEISKMIPLRDAMLIQIHPDGTTDFCSRIDRSKAMEMNVAEHRIVNQIKGNTGNKVSFKSENGDDDCVAYPLVDHNRLIGILFLYFNEVLEEVDAVTTEFCVQTLRMEFALYVLNEEREVWESFYSNSVSA